MAMNPRAVGALSALALFFACAAGPDPVPPKESRMQEKIEIIEAEQLRDFLAQGGCVALGKVLKVELFNQGTRGSRLRIHVEVEKPLHGSLPRQLSFLTWGKKDEVMPGQQLLLAVKPPAPQAPDAVLQSFFVVPEGRGEEAARAQQEVLAKVGPAK